MRDLRDLRDLRPLRPLRDLRDLRPPLRDLRDPLRPLRDLRDLRDLLRLRPPVNPGISIFPPEGKMEARGFLRPPLFNDLLVLRPPLRYLRLDFLTFLDFLDFLDLRDLRDLRLTFLDLRLRPPVIPKSERESPSVDLFFLVKNIFYILTQQKN